VERLEAERRRLEANLAQLTPAEMIQPGCVGEWSAKDVLAHLADWEGRMVPWVEASRRGEAVETPEPGLTIRQLKIVNARIYERHRDRTLEDVLAYFRDTHRQFMEMVVYWTPKAGQPRKGGLDSSEDRRSGQWDSSGDDTMPSTRPMWYWTSSSAARVTARPAGSTGSRIRC